MKRKDDVWANEETRFVVEELYRADFSGWCRMAESVVNDIRQWEAENGESEHDPFEAVTSQIYCHICHTTFPKQLELVHRNLLDAALSRIDWEQITTFLIEASQKQRGS
jgi:hypothetical protein